MSKEADRVLELDAKATEGPWEKTSFGCLFRIVTGKGLGHITIADSIHEKDMDAIAEFRTLAPALARRVKELEAERDKLHEALSRCRGQWIHSIHRDRCLEAIGEKETPK